jgi:anti-sigma regulatory factor (Ser/Thr protein kinase)
MKSAGHLAFELPATPAAVDALCAQADAWLIEAGLGTESFPVAMLLRESLNNSMLHGCGNDRKRFIRCEIRRGRKWLHIVVADDGPGFDWCSRLECRAGIEECHGRGLEIYRLYADEVNFNRRGNRVRLRRRIAG